MHKRKREREKQIEHQKGNTDNVRKEERKKNRLNTEKGIQITYENKREKPTKHRRGNTDNVREIEERERIQITDEKT